jgi:hypothetical protein
MAIHNKRFRFLILAMLAVFLSACSTTIRHPDGTIEERGISPDVLNFGDGCWKLGRRINDKKSSLRCKNEFYNSNSSSITTTLMGVADSNLGGIVTQMGNVMSKLVQIDSHSI